MPNTTAKLRSGSKIFETMVDLDNAMKLKKGEQVNINDVIRDNVVWTDLKKGMKAGESDLKKAFGTTDFNSVVEKIVKKGNMEITQEYRDEAVETKRKQIVDFLVRNAIDSRTDRPFTPDMIESAISQVGVKIDNQPVERQIKNVIEALKKNIPIKIETKKILVKIPAEHTGRVYGLIQEYKEKENWLQDGSLEVVLNIPVGLQSEFYDKLNGVTHGSAVTSEIKEE